MNKNIFIFIIFTYLFSSTDTFTSSKYSEQISNMQEKELEYMIEKGIIPRDSLLYGMPDVEMSFSDSLYIKQLIENQQVDSDSIKYFGYNFFQPDTTMFFWNNQPPPIDYVLGPGDEIIIEIWGEAQVESVHTVDLYGKVYIDNIGQVYLTGKNIQEAEKILLRKFQKVYSSLTGVNPSAFLDISIGKLKSTNVTFVGEVFLPGMHAIHSFSTIITSLIQIGGVQETGSLRDIQLIRDGKIASTLDFYQYIINGVTKGDQRLLDGDIIRVPVRHSTVRIEGEVMREAIYELLNDETIGDLSQFAGGFTAKAHNELHIHRFNSMNQLLPTSSIDETYIIDYINEKDFILFDGDEVLVNEIFPSLHEIFIYGQVKSPGKYSFATNRKIMLLDLLTISGGLNDPTYLKSIYKHKGEVVRMRADQEYPDIIEFNLSKLLSGDIKSNIQLQNWDVVLIRENPNYRAPNKVWIQGEVKVPGVYTLNKEGETLDDLLIRAEGFTSKAYEKGIQIYREDIQLALHNYDISLMDGDSIMVPGAIGVVHVIGQVNVPGIIQYKPSKSLKSYINHAGGISGNGSKKNITIIYANGNVKTKTFLRNPKISDGSTIIVHEKLETEFNVTQFATNLSTIVTSFATIFLLISQQ